MMYAINPQTYWGKQAYNMEADCACCKEKFALVSGFVYLTTVTHNGKPAGNHLVPFCTLHCLLTAITPKNSC